MRKTILFNIFIVIVAVQSVQAQKFDSNQQYNQAMANARQAFEAKQFSEAVMFYREAIKIKPDALLPKYKIEDIRTIYIANELIAPMALPVQAESTKAKDKSNKEIELEVATAAELAEAEATRKMNEDADKAEAELRELRIDVVEINEDVDANEIAESIKVDEIAGDKEAAVKKVEPKTQTKIEGETTKGKNPTMDLTKREVPVIVEKDKEPLPVPEKKEPVIETKPIVKTAPPVVKPKPENPVEKEKWVEQEKERLKVTYPNKKTVEEIDKPGKHITRVIMNIDNDVTVYLKVNHSWGAIFFFIDEVGLELRSINEAYYNSMTNLKTYD